MSKNIFANLLLAGLVFLVLAFVVSFIDFVLFWRARNTQRQQLATQMNQWIQQQIEEKEQPASDDNTSQSE